jgi:hypothetical protein
MKTIVDILKVELLADWDTAIVDLNRDNNLFVARNVRLRDCSLHYSNALSAYYIKYKDVTFAMFDIYNKR